MTHITLREAAEQALEALKPVYATAKNTKAVREGYSMSGYIKHYEIPVHVVTALRAALNEASKEVEPVAWMYLDKYGSLKLSQTLPHEHGVFPVFTHPAPAVPEGWLRAVDEALVTAHLGVANTNDSYEDAKKKLDALIDWSVQVAIDPAVNGGFVLVPQEPTGEMVTAGSMEPNWTHHAKVYRAMLAAAPEPKP